MKCINVLTKTYGKERINTVKSEWLLNECGLNAKVSNYYEKSLLSLCDHTENVNNN